MILGALNFKFQSFELLLFSNYKITILILQTAG